MLVLFVEVVQTRQEDVKTTAFSLNKTEKDKNTRDEEKERKKRKKKKSCASCVIRSQSAEHGF